MTVAIRPASGNDLPDLLELMHQFYAESGYPLNVDRARSAFLPLLVPGQLGQVWLADFDGQLAGHLVLTFCYSMEYGGRSAFVDDLFVRPAMRKSWNGPGAGGTCTRHMRGARGPRDAPAFAT